MYNKSGQHRTDIDSTRRIDVCPMLARYKLWIYYYFLSYAGTWKWKSNLFVKEYLWYNA